MVTTISNKLYHHWVVNSDQNSNVLGFEVRNEGYRQAKDMRGVVLAGTMILDREALSYTDGRLGSDYIDLVKPLIEKSKLKNYVSPSEAFFDINTPEQFEEAETYIKRLIRTG